MKASKKSRLEQKKTLILDAAKELFVKYGKQVTLASIADAIDMDKSSLYYYFKSIPEIIDTILDQEYHDFTLDNIRFKDIETNPISVLKQMVIMITEFYYDNMPLLHIILTQVFPMVIDEDYREDSVAINHFLDTYRDANKSLEDVIKRAQKTGQLSDKFSSFEILHTIRGYIFGLFTTWLEDRPPRESIPEKINQLLTLYH